MMIFDLDQLKVQTKGRHYIAPGAVVIGNVLIESEVSIWFNAVIRGDNDTIVLSRGCNIQDGAILHVDPGHPLHVGERVTVGHKAILHGCTVGNRSLIGMNAVVLNDAVIGEDCLIGANALVKEGMQIPDRSLVLGSPAKIVRELDDDALQQIAAGAQSYIDKIELYQTKLVPSK